MNPPAHRRHVTKEEIEDSMIDGAEDSATGSEMPVSDETLHAVLEEQIDSSAESAERTDQDPVIGLA